MNENQANKKCYDRRGVLICGAYGMSNAGDEAVLDAICAEMRAIDPEMPITVLSRTPDITAQRHGVNAIHSFRIFRFLREMRRCRLYINGGGSLIQDVTSTRSLWYYLFTIAAAKRRGCRVLMYGCGIGPVSGRRNRSRVKKVLNRYVDAITLREPDSLETLRAFGVDVPEITVASDPALSLAPAPAAEVDAMMEKYGLDPNGRYLCVCLRDWPGFREKAPLFARAADYARETYGMHPVFLAVNQKQDNRASELAAGFMQGPCTLIPEPLAPALACGLLSRMSAVLSMRLHGLIFAAAGGVPPAGISYDPKVASFLDYLEMDNYADFNALTDETQLTALIDRAAAMDREALRARTAKIREIEQRNVTVARRLLGKAEDGRKRIAIFQSDLNVGGIQKALLNILNDVDYDRCEVDVFIYDDKCFFDMPQHEHLQLHFIKPYPFLNRLVYFELLHRFARRPPTDKDYDIAIDFNSYRNECAVGAVTVSARKRIMWIHNDVEIKQRNEAKYRILWHFFKAKLKYYDEFAAVSPGIIDGFRRVSGIYDRKITPIPNHIDTGEIFRKVKEPVDLTVDPACYNLCTMGRICHQKGFDLLMDYMAEVHALRPDIRLYLLGDGPDREKITAQIARLGLQDTVTLLGNKANPFPYVDLMDGFVLTSRYEGQGLVIWEAKTLGLEIFITDNLEKYNPGIPGRKDIVAALAGAERKEKVYDDLAAYNAAIRESLKEVLEL